MVTQELHRRPCRMHLSSPRRFTKVIPDLGVLNNPVAVVGNAILIQARDEYEHDHDRNEKQQLARQHFD